MLLSILDLSFAVERRCVVDSHAWHEKWQRRRAENNVRAMLNSVTSHTPNSLLYIFNIYFHSSCSPQIIPHALLAGTEWKITFNILYINSIPPISRNLGIRKIINEGTKYTWMLSTIQFYLVVRSQFISAHFGGSNASSHSHSNIDENWLICSESFFRLRLRFIVARASSF